MHWFYITFALNVHIALNQAWNQENEGKKHVISLDCHFNLGGFAGSQAGEHYCLYFYPFRHTDIKPWKYIYSFYSRKPQQAHFFKHICFKIASPVVSAVKLQTTGAAQQLNQQKLFCNLRFWTQPILFSTITRIKSPAIGSQQRNWRTLSLEELAADDFGHWGHLLFLELLGWDAGVEVME